MDTRIEHRAPASLARRAAAEALGTGLLLAAIVGSGIMGERLSGGNIALALLTNSVATGAALVAILLSLGEISGAHLNPVVSLSMAWEKSLAWRDVPAYLGSQCAGAVLGVAVADAMFSEPLFSVSLHARQGPAQWLSEAVATFGLVSVVWGCARTRPASAPFAVGAYITAAYWFTSSTSFANPAVTLARSVTNTFAGIRPTDVPAFIVAQLAGAVIATVVLRGLAPLEKVAETSASHTSLPEPHPSKERNHMKTILFACVHNAGRSQMAAALFNQAADPAVAHAISAGTEPGARVHPEVVTVMRETGIDLSAATPQKLTDLLAKEAQILVTMGCGDACPFVPGARVEDWPVQDPKGQPLDAVRSIRDDIRRRVLDLMHREGVEAR
jgi:arsenate reductase